MSLIKILPENLVNQIAAGEVVERPASVVKELIDNSLDSGADRIVLEVKNSGKTLIKITDNGCGMSREDCELALHRHATSKLKDEAGLWDIKTMGFRGEALPSISSVSQLTIRSKCKDDMAGTEINCHGGEVKTIEDVGMNDGTQVEVRSLFFNTPARQKYLKKEATELGHISSTFNTIALAHPEIAFKFIHNENVVMDLPKTTDLISRIADVFGKATADAFVPIFYGGTDFGIDGFVGKPAVARSTSQHQYFFVNGRPIQHFLLANFIKQAFHSMLMEGKKPIFVINIKIDPSLIDVNVHPRKIEIRFEDQKTIAKTLYAAVKKSIEKENLIPKGFTESKRYMSDTLPGGGRPDIPQFGSPKKSDVQDALAFSKNFFTDRKGEGLKAETLDDAKEMQSIFQVANSYIVAQSEDGLVLIDQHAAHERVRYEQLMDQFEKKEKIIQPLLVPMEIEFTKDEYDLIEENIGILESLGFDMEKGKGKTFLVNGVPGFLSNEDIDQVVKGVLDDIINEKAPSKFQGGTEEIINYMACRSAIKFGQSLSLDEMQALIDQLEKLKRPYTCPHGRPTMISLDLNELGKMFGRK